MSTLKKFARYQLPAIIWATVIFIESSIPDLSPSEIIITAQDKIAHALVYGVLGYLITRSLYYQSNNTLRKHAILFSIIIGLLYGISDEFHQSFVPGRYPEFADLIADFVGVILAQFFFIYRRRKIEN